MTHCCTFSGSNPPSCRHGVCTHHVEWHATGFPVSRHGAGHFWLRVSRSAFFDLLFDRSASEASLFWPASSFERAGHVEIPMISANGHFSIASFTCFCLEVPFKHQTLLNYVEIDSPRLVKHYLCLQIHYLNHTLLVDLVHKNTTKTKRKSHDNNR